MKKKLLAGLIGLSLSVYATDSYDDCIFENMKGVTSDVAAEAIKKSCRNKFQSKWEITRTVKFTSNRTKNNDNHTYQTKYCDHASPDGKYCADEVRITGQVPQNDKNYIYRFKKITGCPIHISSGPQGWMKLLSCSLSPNGKSFNAQVMGWTKPQTFTATLTIERKKR